MLSSSYFPRSQEVFRKAMSSPLVHVEVLPVANKPRYEKSLIGQLFTGDMKDSTAKANSPLQVRAKTDSQPEPKQDVKLNAKREARQPGDTYARTQEAAAVNPPPVEPQSGHSSLERISPTPPARAASSSPTPRSPLPSKSPVLPNLANLTNRKGGKRINIDLKKGKMQLNNHLITFIIKIIGSLTNRTLSVSNKEKAPVELHYSKCGIQCFELFH